MQFIELIAAFVLTIGAFVALVFRVLYPYHRLFALALYTASWGLLLYSLWKIRDSIFMRSEKIADLAMGYTPYFVWIGLSFVFLFFLWFFRFRVSSALSQSTPEDFQKMSEDDVTLITYLDHFLEESVKCFEESYLSDSEKKEYTPQERQDLRALWKAIFDYMVEIDLLRNRYEEFYTFVGKRRDDHVMSFALYFQCLLLQHYYAHRAKAAVKNNQALEKVINDYDSSLGLPEHSFDLSVEKNSQTSEILQINLGRAYCEILDEEISAHPLYCRAQEILSYMNDHVQTFTVELFKNPLKQFERSAATTFFPWQKKIAYGMSLIRVTDRPFLITPDFIAKQKRSLEPGDVLLERREWFATNVGIPGYWTHSALHIGSLDEIDTFFSQLPEFEDLLPSEYIAKEYPAVYEQLHAKDEDGFVRRVIEVKSPGVIVTSFEHSASCDALGILRPLLSPQEKWKMITRAMSYYGLPYDYNFDFSTDGSLVCSELIYKSLEDVSTLSLEAVMTNGRLLFTPNQFVEKFDQECETEGQSFNFVLFWDGDEKTEEVHVREVEDFRASWKRPKWHVLEQYFEE